MSTVNEIEYTNAYVMNFNNKGISCFWLLIAFQLQFQRWPGAVTFLLVLHIGCIYIGCSTFCILASAVNHGHEIIKEMSIRFFHH
jgi:hypothetical protein